MGSKRKRALLLGAIMVTGTVWGCIPGAGGLASPSCDGGPSGTDPAGETCGEDTDTGLDPGLGDDAGSGEEEENDECVPATCEGLDLAAGLWLDGCGGTLDCGTWTHVPGGVFQMGSDVGDTQAQPAHEVSVGSFDMWATEVTMEQYAVCVNSGGCDDAITVLEDPGCTWGTGSDQTRPVNCVTWYQAREFCQWAGGRLPSEAEWEFAARGGGLDRRFPWDGEIPDCAHAVMVEAGVTGCGTGTTWSVCSLPAGNTAGGLCDMSGNVHEWVEDDYHLGLTNTGGYDVDGDGESDAPADGSAWVDEPRGTYRHLRGGGFSSTAADLTTTARFHHNTPGYWAPRIGFRCARDGS